MTEMMRQISSQTAQWRKWCVQWPVLHYDTTDA